MNHWRCGTFWASLVAGWFLTMVCLAVLFRMFVPEPLSPAMDWVLVISQQVLSLAAGYAHGREQFERRQRKQVGFPVVPKRDGDSDAR